MKMEERVELATYVGKNHVILACDIGSSFNTPHDRNHIVKKPPIILSFQIKHAQPDAYVGKNHVILACDIDNRNHIVKKPPIILSFQIKHV
jgi:hypothetical protein